MAGNVRSAKSLCSLVSGTSVLKSMEMIALELQNNAEWLLNGVSYYKKAGNSSTAQIKEIHKDAEIEFIGKLHKILDIDVVQCSELFRSFVSREYKGTKKNLQKLLSNERHTETMLFELWNYYYSERLYCLLTLKHILQHWQDEKNRYKDLYGDFLKCINENGALFTKVIVQLEDSFASQVPAKNTHWASMYDRVVNNWIMYTLREQSEILQVLLLYCRTNELKVKDITKLFNMFQKHGFGTRQPFRQFISEENHTLVEAIGYLECMNVIQCFRLDLLIENIGDTMNAVDHFLLNDTDSIKMLDTLVHGLGTLRPHAPIMMTWALINTKLNSFNLNNVVVLGNSALQMNVFEYLLTASKLTVFSQKGAVTETLNLIIYELLCQLLTEFELSALGRTEPIFQLLESALKFKVISEDFWKNGINNGCGVLVKRSLDQFPFELQCLLKLSCSLAQSGKESAQKVLKLIKGIQTFCESVENIGMSDATPSSDGSALKLTKSRAIYGDENLIINAGTLGYLIQDSEKGQTIVQWQVYINGWQVCLRELYIRIQEMTVNLGVMNSENFATVVVIADLVHSLLKSDSNIKDSLIHIINMLFSLLQRVSTYPNPPLDFISKMFDVSAVLHKVKKFNAWSNISKLNFMPSVSGLSLEIKELASGSYVNIGLLGEMISSKECVLGKYQLCISFVKFIVTLSKDLPDDGESSYLACVLYILKEIFSVFHKWFYVDPQEKLIIGQECLTLLHSLFTVEIEEERNTMIKVKQICLFSLMYYEAGQTLLRIICTGESVIHQTILRQNSDFAECITGLIRLSLSVLNRLLLLRHQIVEQLKILPGQSPFERILLSTPGQSECPQVMLTVANYAFQHYNPCLATLAVQLLKRFAKEFPMSLLACFASDAEAIRDHFLSRLCSKCEDIRLKVSIIEFLTVCITQQPGLIEMFINITVKDQTNQTIVIGDQQSCLTSVKNILKENPENQCEYFKELQCVAVEFIHALWSAYQCLAMDALKKDPEFWSYFCARLLSENMEMTHPRFAAHVIRTLALELFYYSTYNQSGVWSDSVKKIVAIIKEKNLLAKWSKNINHTWLEKDSTKKTIKNRLSLEPSHLEDVPVSFDLFTAWRDLIIIIAKNETQLNLIIPMDIKNEIMLDILGNISKKINKGHPRVLVLLSEFYLTLMNFWANELSLSALDETFNLIQDLLQHLAVNADKVYPSIQLALVTAAIYFITQWSKVKDKTKLSFVEWVYPVCKLLRNSSNFIDQPGEKEQLISMLKIPIAVICLLNKLIQESDNWLPVLKSHITLPLLVSLLMKSLKMKYGARLALTIITLFISVATNKEAAEALCNTGFMSDITLLLSSVKLELDDGFEHDIKVLKREITATNVFYAFLMLIRMLLQALGNYFLPDALDFIGVHMEHLHATLVHIVQNPLSPNLWDAVLTCSLIYQLSFHHSLWQLQHQKSFEILLNDISICSHVAIALLMRQNLLKHLLEQKEFPKRDTEHKNLFLIQTSAKQVPVDSEAVPSERMVQVQTELMKLLSVCLAILKHYSPSLQQTMYGQRIDDGQWQLLLNTTFQTPSIDQKSNLTFGALSNCVNMCLRWLGKSERTPSPSRSFEISIHVERHLLLYVLEMSLNLLLSQCSLALTHPDMSVREKQLIKREMAAELNGIIQSVNRYLRRAPISPSDSMSSPRQSVTADLPFMKFIDSVLKKIVE